MRPVRIAWQAAGLDLGRPDLSNLHPTLFEQDLRQITWITNSGLAYLEDPALVVGCSLWYV